MATKKVTITLPDEVLEYIKASVDERGVSAYVTAAVENQVRIDKLGELNALLQEEYGELTEEELRAADAWLDEMDAKHDAMNAKPDALRQEGEITRNEGKAAA
ncbi:MULTISPECIES: hypothetical protein [unclassified Streptomyces]|uniref:hypothetical protein n=1 Tax=unclassified Streptomyces TaxID=2593676 RepID=UPI0033198AA9